MMQNCPPPPLQVSVVSCVWEESLGYTYTGPRHMNINGFPIGCWQMFCPRQPIECFVSKRHYSNATDRKVNKSILNLFFFSGQFLAILHKRWICALRTHWAFRKRRYSDDEFIGEWGWGGKTLYVRMRWFNYLMRIRRSQVPIRILLHVLPFFSHSCGLIASKFFEVFFFEVIVIKSKFLSLVLQRTLDTFHARRPLKNQGIRGIFLFNF